MGGGVGGGHGYVGYEQTPPQLGLAVRPQCPHVYIPPHSLPVGVVEEGEEGVGVQGHVDGAAVSEGQVQELIPRAGHLAVGAGTSDADGARRLQLGEPAVEGAEAREPAEEGEDGSLQVQARCPSLPTSFQIAILSPPPLPDCTSARPPPPRSPS